MQADKIPGEIMREAWGVQNAIHRPEHDGHDAVKIIARALMARDKRAAEIALTGGTYPITRESIATAILTYGGRDEQR